MSNTSRVDLYDQSISLIERYTRCLVKDKQLKNKNETFTDLASQVAYYIGATDVHVKTQEVFCRFIDNVEGSEQDRKEIIKQYKKEVEENFQTIGDVEENRRYQEYLELISDDNNTSEILTISESVNTIDPISKLQIVNPVKNKKCGHTYEKTTILELISKNKNLRCPMVGCNVQGIKQDDLVDDHKMKRYIDSQKPASNSNKKDHAQIILDESSQGELTADED